MFGSATMPFVLNSKAVPKSNNQRLMEIRRPNLNLQDKYVMMNGQIIERSKYRAPNPSRADQYAALLEAHKTSRYMRNENPLEDPYVTRRLDQTAKINDYLHKANVTKVKAEIINTITEISKKHIALTKSLAQGQKDVANNIKREIIALGRESQGLARTIAAPDNNGRVNLERLFSQYELERDASGIDDLGALIAQAGSLFNDTLGANDYEAVPGYDYEVGPDPVFRYDPVPPPVEIAPQAEPIAPQAEEAAPQAEGSALPVVDNGDPAVDTNVSDVLPILQDELSNLQTIDEFSNKPIANRLQMLRDAQQAAEGIVNEKEPGTEQEQEAEAEGEEEPRAVDKGFASVKGLKYVKSLARVQGSSNADFDALDEFANRVAEMVPAIGYGPGGNRLDPLEIASRIIFYGKPKFYRTIASNKKPLSDLAERLNDWGISYIRYPKSSSFPGIRYSKFRLDEEYDMLVTDAGALTRTEALERSMYYAITFDESNLGSGKSSIASATQSSRSIKVADALTATSGSEDELYSMSFALDLFKAVLNPKYKGVAKFLTERVNPTPAPVSTPLPRKSARLQKRNEEAEAIN